MAVRSRSAFVAVGARAVVATSGCGSDGSARSAPDAARMPPSADAGHPEPTRDSGGQGIVSRDSGDSHESARDSGGVPGALAGRTVPEPLFGVTLDDVSDVSDEVTSLFMLAHMPTTRVYFDATLGVSSYTSAIAALHGTTYLMGELIDSSDMPMVTTASAAEARARSFTGMLGGQVDIWEVGNEVNGDWLDTSTQPTLGKVEAMYDVVAVGGGATALTFFYEGEPSDVNNCIATDNGGNDMFTWLHDQLDLADAPSARPAASEAMRLGLDYVLVSWYPDQCPGESPDWTTVMTQLSSIFPNAKVGFGELGTANPQNGSTFEQNEIKTYYPLAKSLTLPPAYIGGYFWWYYAEEMVPTDKTVLFGTLNAAIQ
jgi:hypothetical protein